MVKERILWADSLKGLLMILVIIGHAIQVILGNDCENNHAWNLIYSFHMPAFMSVSGWFAYRLDRKKNGYFSVCVRRSNQVLVPYFFWSLFNWIIGGGSLERLPLLITNPDSYFWFLWVLFWICIIFVGCQWLADKLKIDELIPIGLVGLILMSIMVGLEFRMFGFQFLAYYFIFYTLGYCIHRYPLLQLKNNIVIGFFIIVWVFFAWFWNMHGLPSWMPSISCVPSSLLQYGYRGLTALLGVMILLGISPLILNADTYFNRWFKELGVVSLGLYVVHLIIIGFLKVPLYTIIPNCEEWLAIVILSVVTFMFSAIIVCLLKKNKWTAKICLGKI